MKHIKKFESEEYVPKFINTKPNLEEDNENEYPEFSQSRELKSDYLYLGCRYLVFQAQSQLCHPHFVRAHLSTLRR